MVCREWSPWNYERFQGRCGMWMLAETGNNVVPCALCIVPVLVPIACGGTATYEAQEVGGGPLPAIEWVLIENNCTGDGVPVPPVSTPITGETETTNCDCE